MSIMKDPNKTPENFQKFLKEVGIDPKAVEPSVLAHAKMHAKLAGVVKVNMPGQPAHVSGSEPTYPALVWYDSKSHGKRRFIRGVDMKAFKPEFTYEIDQAYRFLDKVSLQLALSLCLHCKYAVKARSVEDSVPS